MKTAIIIGSGFSGLSAAARLAQGGYSVTVLEKNEMAGGRARQFQEKGYTFDMGPSWYWMPDVFDRFFASFGKDTSDYYLLEKLDPGFHIIFRNNETLEVPAGKAQLAQLFEELETGSSAQLELFLAEAAYKYRFSMNSLIYQPGLSWKEVCSKDVLQNLFKLQLFQSYKKHVAQHFQHPKLRALMEFPVLFLGSSPKDTPALYSLMAYSGLEQGTYYPKGGFQSVIQGMVRLCKELGVSFHYGEAVQKIQLTDGKATGVTTNKRSYHSDIIVGSADYQHIEQTLLPKTYRNYSKSYWEKKTLSPSCLLYYVGVSKRLKKLDHHNLFFDEDINEHISAIYEKKEWPKEPLFYACCPSKTDPAVAPKGKENLFLLIPISPGIKDTEEIRAHYFEILLSRLEAFCGENIREAIEYQRSYCIKDFEQDYNAYKGNAYGLANTLLQTANLKPKIQNKKAPNLFYAGQLTVPGPGVPPALISGDIVAQQILKQYPPSS